MTGPLSTTQGMPASVSTGATRWSVATIRACLTVASKRCSSRPAPTGSPARRITAASVVPRPWATARLVSSEASSGVSSAIWDMAAVGSPASAISASRGRWGSPTPGSRSFGGPPIGTGVEAAGGRGGHAPSTLTSARPGMPGFRPGPPRLRRRSGAIIRSAQARRARPGRSPGFPTMSDDDAIVYRVTDATSWREVDGEVVVLGMETSTYYSIGGVGTLLWPLLVIGASRRRLVDELSARFSEQAPVDIAADIDAFLDRCLELGIVEEASRP